MKTVIMAGGKGTRLASITGDIPKPMVSICGKPILEYQIECLRRNGLTDIIIVVGHLGQQIKDYFKDGNNFNCNISYYTENEPLGTAGALYKIENLIGDFLLLNGDIIFDIDINRMIAFHKEKKALATITVHPNSHPFDSALILTDNNNRVTGWLNKEDERVFYRNQVNAGIHIISSDLLKCAIQSNDKMDLDRDILKPSIQTNRIYAYTTPEYIKDMGTPERYEQVSAEIANSIVKSKNLMLKQKAIFLDRDGTINKFIGFVRKPQDFELLEGVADAIKKINSLGFLAIIITNQPVIARGEVDFNTLDLIHMKMETELGKYGAYIDAIFYCPHHPDRGFPGELLEYKTECNCRKPKPGMILKAAEIYNIDVSISYMVGDDERDIKAGLNAGCIPVLLTDDKIYDNIMHFKNLKEFTDSF